MLFLIKLLVFFIFFCFDIQNNKFSMLYKFINNIDVALLFLSFDDSSSFF